MSNSASNDSNLSEQAEEQAEINISVNPSNNNNIHDNADNDSQSEDGTQQVGTSKLLSLYQNCTRYKVFITKVAKFYCVFF